MKVKYRDSNNGRTNECTLNIYNNRKFFWRFVYSLVWAVIVILPFVCWYLFTVKFLAEPTIFWKAFGAAFVCSLLVAGGEVIIVGAMHLLKLFFCWIFESKIIHKWLYWLVAGEDANNFVEKI